MHTLRTLKIRDFTPSDVGKFPNAAKRELLKCSSGTLRTCKRCHSTSEFCPEKVENLKDMVEDIAAKYDFMIMWVPKGQESALMGDILTKYGTVKYHYRIEDVLHDFFINI